MSRREPNSSQADGLIAAKALLDIAKKGGMPSLSCSRWAPQNAAKSELSAQKSKLSPVAPAYLPVNLHKTDGAISEEITLSNTMANTVVDDIVLQETILKVEMPGTLSHETVDSTQNVTTANMIANNSRLLPHQWSKEYLDYKRNLKNLAATEEVPTALIEANRHLLPHQWSKEYMDYQKSLRKKASQVLPTTKAPLVTSQTITSHDKSSQPKSFEDFKELAMSLRSANKVLIKGISSDAVEVLRRTENSLAIHRALVNELSSPKKQPTSKALRNGNQVATAQKSSSTESDGIGLRSHGYSVILDTGDVFAVSVDDQATSDPRMELAEIPNELVDYKGDFQVVPVSWENDRPRMHGAFVMPYVDLWTKKVHPARSLDATQPCFMNGEYHATADLLMPLQCEDRSMEYPITHPNRTGDAEMDARQMQQTSERSSRKLVKKYYADEKANRIMHESMIKILEESAAQQPDTDPNAPSIELYLRPAHVTDASGIAFVYNHYIKNSIVPEDRLEITTDFIVSLIMKCKHEQLAFIVAVRGPAPRPITPARDAIPHRGQGKRIPATAAVYSTAIVPDEVIIGFSMIEMAPQSAFLGSSLSSMRFNARLHFYTHPDFLRKGVGRCILDRALMTLTRLHNCINSYEFINATNNPVYVYGQPTRDIHQLFLNVPTEAKVLGKDSPEFLWLHDWLEKRFFFYECGRQTGVGRTSFPGTIDRNFDVVQYQYTTKTA